MRQNIKSLCLLTATALAMLTACGPNETDPTEGSTPHEPTQAEMLIGRWQLAEFDGQPVPASLINIDEYRADGMYLYTIDNYDYGTHIADSCLFEVESDSIRYLNPDGSNSAVRIEFLDSVTLLTSDEGAPYGPTTSEYVRL